jgi:type IV pilus assembly protein PilY1
MSKHCVYRCPAFRLGLGMGLLVASSGIRAGTIANIPLYLGVSPPANVILAVDDSGSMFADILMGDGKDVYRSGGKYLFPDNTKLTLNRAGAIILNTWNIPPLPAFAETRSPYYNKAYFDPAVKYLPWESFEISFGQAPENAARWDPYHPNNDGMNAFNLTENIRNDSAGYTFNSTIAGADPNVIIPSGTAYIAA